MTITAEHVTRHNAYRVLSRVLFPRSYIGKILLLTFIAAHIPLLTLIVYTVFVSRFDAATTINLLVVGLVATLVGTGIAMAGLWVLLTPVVSSSRALDRYRHTGNRTLLPLDVHDEGGRLLANVHGTLEGLDTTIGQLEALATRDELTGVYNRREGTRRLVAQLDDREGEAGAVTLVLLDADNLKAINDHLGHSVGDRVLQRFAEVIARQVNDYGWVSRWGGDEFVAVVRESGPGLGAEAVVCGILDELEGTPLLIDGKEIPLRLSAGVAQSAPGDDLERLFNRADAALYRRKRTRQTHGFVPSSGTVPRNQPGHPEGIA